MGRGPVLAAPPGGPGCPENLALSPVNRPTAQPCRLGRRPPVPGRRAWGAAVGALAGVDAGHRLSLVDDGRLRLLSGPPGCRAGARGVAVVWGLAGCWPPMCDISTFGVRPVA